MDTRPTDCAFNMLRYFTVVHVTAFEFCRPVETVFQNCNYRIVPVVGMVQAFAQNHKANCLSVTVMIDSLQIRLIVRSPKKKNWEKVTKSKSHRNLSALVKRCRIAVHVHIKNVENLSSFTRSETVPLASSVWRHHFDTGRFVLELSKCERVDGTKTKTKKKKRSKKRRNRTASLETRF